MKQNIQHYGIFLDQDLYQNQINWIIKQIDNCKDDSFNDIEKAKARIGNLETIQLGKGQNKKQLQRNLKLAENNLHGFRNTFLSEAGFRKLNSTLKIARKRHLDKEKGARNLDVTVSQEVFERLEEILRKSETVLTKNAFIGKLIMDYDQRTDPAYHEKQLELGSEWSVYTKFSQIKPGAVMRLIDSGIEHTVSELDGKTIIFDDGSELSAYQAKQKYEINH